MLKAVLGAGFCLAVLAAGVASAAPKGHYLFAWAGDAESKGEDFLAVIDADPASPTYGRTVASAASGVRSQQAHHSEYWMPESGLLFANDHVAGKTVIMDVRDPVHPRVHATFGDLDGFSHPHSFLRLPNGHVLASFQVEGHLSHAGMAGMDHGHSTDGATDIGALPGVHGGLVEIDDEGRAIRSASNADPARPNDFLMAYSLLPLPEIDRVVVTNSPMRGEDRNGRTYQIFRLSDLKRLSTNNLDPGKGQYGEINPEEARRGPDGSVYIQTLGCGIERITGLTAPRPRSKLVWQFPGSNCGVPTIVSHYLIQSVPILHALVVLDISRGDRPREVSRLFVDPVMQPHWTVYDAKTHRLALTGHEENRLYMLTFDEKTGALGMDPTFRDADGKVGIDFDGKTWPHGWTGSAIPHGVVFSR